MKHTTTSAMLVVLTLLFLCGITPEAKAQRVKFLVSADTFEPVGVSAVEANPHELSRPVLVNMSKAWWKALRKEHIRALGSGDETAKAQALQNIIYFTLYYPGQFDMGRATARIYEIYRLDKNEQMRVMALVALHAIGREQTMRQLAQDVRRETSPRLRRMTQAVLVDYFNGSATSK